MKMNHPRHSAGMIVLFADVINEGVGEVVTVINGMVLTTFFLPVVLVGREERVGLGGRVVDLRQTETVGEGQGLTVDRGTADDVDVFVGGAVLQGRFERGIDITARVEAVQTTPNPS